MAAAAPQLGLPIHLACDVRCDDPAAFTMLLNPLLAATPPPGSHRTTAVFPNVPVPPSQTLAAGYSECAMKGLAVRPRKGDAGKLPPNHKHGGECCQHGRCCAVPACLPASPRACHAVPWTI
jgi:hypothetical protein